MTTWFALRFDESSFDSFDTLPDQAGRQVHLEGEIARALMLGEDDLLAGEPEDTLRRRARRDARAVGRQPWTHEFLSH